MLDIRVNVLECRVEREVPLFQLAAHLLQPLDELLSLRTRENALLGEHPHVRDAAAQILSPEPLIERDRR